MFWFSGLIYDGYQQQWIRLRANNQDEFRTLLQQQFPVHVCIWWTKES